MCIRDSNVIGQDCAVRPRGREVITYATPAGVETWDFEREVTTFARHPVGRKHLVIPDTQVRPGVPIEHARWIGRYIADKGPDVVVHLGDHWDMPSLSSYDSLAKKVARGTAKKADIDSGNQFLEELEDELVIIALTCTR